MKKDALLEFKLQGKRIKVITAYDFSQAKCAEAANMDAVLVGDSLANVVLGLGSTRSVGMDEMTLFTAAVSRGLRNTLLIADMPFGADENPALALQNAKKLVNAGADFVKLEGPRYSAIRELVAKGIPVVGHLGLTPQTALNFKQVGNDPVEAEVIFEQSLELQNAGISALVLEHIPSALGEKITKALEIPTIGIGAGKQCGGQVLVWHDALGCNKGPVPKIARKFASIYDTALEGLEAYGAWVETEEEI